MNYYYVVGSRETSRRPRDVVLLHVRADSCNESCHLESSLPAESISLGQCMAFAFNLRLCLGVSGECGVVGGRGSLRPPSSSHGGWFPMPHRGYSRTSRVMPSARYMQVAGIAHVREEKLRVSTYRAGITQLPSSCSPDVSPPSSLARLPSGHTRSWQEAIRSM